MTKNLDDMNFEKNSNGNIINNDSNREKMLDLLDTTGKGFCLAKWTQVTMHLGVGLTHSCHHPGAHSIPLDELETNPGALHNTKFKKERRKEMLSGKRPAECDFCWRIEDNTKEFSDRVYKSLDAYSVYDHDIIKQMTGEEDIFPRYVEVSFSNVCNFKCSYCGPTFSSKWVEEIKSKGPYTNSVDGMQFNYIKNVQLTEREENPYTDAFWKWFPEAVTHMHTFRITGGEPLLNKNTMRVIDYLLENPHPNLEFAINSNGNPPFKIWEEFTQKVSRLMSEGRIKKFTLFTSAESVGKQAEYSRFGMNWEDFQYNIDYFLKNTEGTRVGFMAAFNILSLPTFIDFLKYILNLKRTYNKSGFYSWLEECGLDTEGIIPYGDGKRYIDRENDKIGNNANRVGVDIPYVRNPDFLDCKIASIELIEKYLLPATEFMFRNQSAADWDSMIGFENWEAAKLKRILVDVLCKIKNNRNPDETSTDESIAKCRVKFIDFVNEYDNRRNTNFLDSFPEFSNFVELCKMEKIKYTNE